MAALVLLPDSIRFLLVKGGEERAGQAVPRAHRAGRGHPGATCRRASTSIDSGGALRRAASSSRKGERSATTLIWVIYFMNLLNLYFLNSWLPTIISDAGIPVGTAIRLTSLFQIGGIGGALVLGRVLDRHLLVLGPGRLLRVGGGVRLPHRQAGASVPLLAVTIACAGLGIIGGQNASHALSSEFYPTRMRSTGVGWALGIGRIGSIVGPVVGGQLLAQGTAARQVFWAAAVPALDRHGGCRDRGCSQTWTGLALTSEALAGPRSGTIRESRLPTIRVLYDGREAQKP